MTGWADIHIVDLLAGKTVTCRPRGGSMAPRVLDGQVCHIDPITVDQANIGDVVLCEVGGRQFLHLVLATIPGEALIGNKRGHYNGWTSLVYGRLLELPRLAEIADQMPPGGTKDGRPHRHRCRSCGTPGYYGTRRDPCGPCGSGYA